MMEKGRDKPRNHKSKACTSNRGEDSDWNYRGYLF